MSRAVNKAFKTTPRSHFLPPSVAKDADLDMPLPIGHGQTNSQPTTVRLMLEWLKVRQGNKVLEVGSGSGWTSAMLARLTGPSGKVVAVERIPELLQMGKGSCHSLGIMNISFCRALDVYGWPAGAPYNRILVNAVASSVPPELIEQLAHGGRLVIPVKNDIVVIEKDKHGALQQEVHPGFVFVPLLEA